LVGKKIIAKENNLVALFIVLSW